MQLNVLLMALRSRRMLQIDSLNDLSTNLVLDFLKNDYLRIHITANEIDTNVENPNEFLDKNPGCVIFNLPLADGNVFHESTLQFRAADTKAIENAKKIAREFRKITRTGAIAVYSEFEEEPSKVHRYSAGAKTKFEEGYVMKPTAGRYYLKLQ